MSLGESVRNRYRNQGAQQAIEAAVRHILEDAVISTTVDVRLLERIVEVVEGSYGSQSKA